MSESSETPCPEKPRRSTQFKPGQSGNPLGRPKRKLDMSVALNKALNRQNSREQSRNDANRNGGIRSVDC